jgi:hypothetical protein
METRDQDQAIRSALRRIEPSVRVDEFCRRLEERRAQMSPRRQRWSAVRIAVTASLAVVLVAGICIGVYAALSHLGQDGQFVVIGDDATTGSTALNPRLPLENPYPIAGPAGASTGATEVDSPWAEELARAILHDYADRDWEVLRAVEQEGAVMKITIGPAPAGASVAGALSEVPTLTISVHREESGQLPQGSNPMKYPEFATDEGHGLIMPTYGDGRESLLSWFIRPDKLMIQVAASPPSATGSTPELLLDREGVKELVSYVASIIALGDVTVPTMVPPLSSTSSTLTSAVQSYLAQLESLWKAAGIPVLGVGTNYPDPGMETTVSENTTSSDVLPYAALELPESVFASADKIFTVMNVMRQTMVAVRRGVPLHYLSMVIVAPDGTKTLYTMGEVYQLAAIPGPEWDRPATLDLPELTAELRELAEQAAAESGVALLHFEVIEDASGRVITAVGSIPDRSAVSASVKQFSAPLETACWNLNKEGAKISGLNVKVDDEQGSPVLRRVVGYNVGGGSLAGWLLSWRRPRVSDPQLGCRAFVWITSRGLVSHLDPEVTPHRLRHPSPPSVLLAFQPPQIRGGHRERGMVQESGHVLDALSGVTPKLGRGVPEDMHPGGGDAGLLQVPPQLFIEGGRRKPRAVCVPV